MNLKQETEPTPFITQVKIIHSIEIQVINLILFQGVIVQVALYDDQGGIIENIQVNIFGSDYTDWGSDDNWIVEYVLRKLNLNKKSNLSESEYTNI